MRILSWREKNVQRKECPEAMSPLSKVNMLGLKSYIYFCEIRATALLSQVQLKSSLDSSYQRTEIFIKENSKVMMETL